MSVLAYSIYWDLPFLIVVVSLVYSATRFEEWGAIWREALRWARRMIVFLLSLAIALYFLSWWLDSGTSWWVPAGVGAAAAVLMLVYHLATSKREHH
jgi:hypothetical protein